MSGLDFSGMNTGGTYVSKEIKPGQAIAKINRISIEKKKTPKDPAVPEYEVFIELETRPMGNDFVGFDKVFGDPSKGQYLGQTKKIKMSNWPIKAYSYNDKKTGKPVTRNVAVQIGEFFQKVLNIVKTPNWITENQSKFKTIEEFVDGFNRSKVFKDVYFKWLLAATEKINTAGYPVYYMFLPDYKSYVPGETVKVCIAAEKEEVGEYDKSIHIIKDKKQAEESEALNNAAADDDDDSFAGDDDDSLFDMDDEDAPY
jgi:hypothetical protein